MADILLNKLINKKIDVDQFIKWLLEADSQEQYFYGNETLKCSRTEFLTHFLNFVHEDIPCSKKYRDSPQKSITSKPVESFQNGETSRKINSSILLNEDRPDINKSASYPLALHKSVETLNNISNDSSTPKISRARSEFIINDAQVSPISPLYRTHTSFSTPVRDNTSFANKSAERVMPLCLGDFIVNKKSSGKKKSSRIMFTSETNEESSKRIKPTSLSNVKTNSSFRVNENSFNNFQDAQEVPVKNLNDSRTFLAEERMKILSRKETVGVTSSKAMVTLTNFKKELEPDVKAISNVEELNRFVGIYACVLKNSLVLNITSEIYFLLSLLLSKYYSESKDDNTVFDDSFVGIGVLNVGDSNIDLNGLLNDEKRSLTCVDLFQNVHNVVYFAVKCLETQIEVLKYYDKSTLNLLSKNKRLQSYSSAFANELAKISMKKTERTLEIRDSASQTNVCFNIDTDNRENFPNDAAFHTLRKQRDIFYEILQIWEQQHSVSDWSFSINLGGKIKSLFTLPSDPTTYIHFCRLFKAQLLSSCSRNQKDDNLSDMSFLSSIPNVNVDKLNRLNCRLVTQQSSNGINSLPHFQEQQEFYRDFILIAANYTFNKHLGDAFAAEIIDLNDTKFSSSEMEEIEDCVDQGTRKEYVACLKSVRILAKFLGFLESIPYKSDCNNVSEKVLNYQIRLRKQACPTIDVKKLLTDAIKQQNITLTVPWVVKYFSMLDYVTLRLPYYLSVHEILFYLYRNCETLLANKSTYASSMIKFCLGWLFELPHFPDSEFFDFCTSALECDVSSLLTSKTESKEVRLDRLCVVDQDVLYLCCPYLEEIKKLLSSNALNRSVTAKHITPVTAVRSSSEITKKRIEQQLEEAFFNGQPLSVRKTVEFVAERVASACVKHICSSIVPPYKKSSLDNLREFLTTWIKHNNINSPTKEKTLKASLQSIVNQQGQSDLETLRGICCKQADGIANDRIPLTVSNLLSLDVLPQTKDICVAITTRTCLDRVQQWIKSHVTLSLFLKDFTVEMNQALYEDQKKIVRQKPPFQLPPGGASTDHNESTASAFHTMEKIRCLSLDVLGNAATIDEETVVKTLHETYLTFTERNDVNECISWYICVLLVDMALLLVTHKPEIIQDDLLKKFVVIWRRCNEKTKYLFKNLFCARNVMLLAQSCNVHEVWRGLAVFVSFLLKENVLPAAELEAQCTSFFQKEWDEDTLSGFNTFLNKFLECYRSYGGDTSKFTLLFEFLSEFCTDL